MFEAWLVRKMGGQVKERFVSGLKRVATILEGCVATKTAENCVRNSNPDIFAKNQENKRATQATHLYEHEKKVRIGENAADPAT
jgi:hypothetical protein